MNALVGYTGFVGSNIHLSGTFDALYHSRNIEHAYGTAPDLLIYAGLRAEKYLANHAPEQDLAQIMQAEENIKNINPKKLVLISTIDVFKTPKGVDESTTIDTTGLHAYGYNRYLLECWVREHFPDALIIRLPALFGKNIKKNFIYDLIYRIPSMLTSSKMQELTGKDSSLKMFYTLQDNGFYKVNTLAYEQQEALRKKLTDVGFSSLNFTDSRNRYQFYPLHRLWEDIQIALKNKLLLWHPATEPISANELYCYLTGEPFTNELSGTVADYDYKTLYAPLFNGKNGYICSKESILQEIKAFVTTFNNSIVRW